MRLHLLTLALASLAASCGGGGDDSAGSSSATLGMLITDAPTDGLSLFTADVVRIELRRPDGTLTGNLLAAPRSFDFLGLAGTSALLGLVSPPPGSYAGIVVGLDPATVIAHDKTGAAVDVRVTRATDDASFRALDASDLTIGGSFRRMLVDVDLEKSLRDDPANPGGLIFELEVEVEHEFEDRGMDEFRGRVLAEDPTAGRFTAELLDETGATSFGRAEVAIGAGTVLLGDDDRAFASAAEFFAALQPGAEVEVHGGFGASGLVLATRVEIEDGLSFPVKIKGDVLSVDANAQTFALLWKEVRRGADDVYPVLSRLGNPRVLTIAWDAATAFAIEDGGAATAAGLIPGAEVYAHFLSFAAPMPFLAAGVEFDEDGAGFEGTITDVSGLPGSIVMMLDGDEPAWIAGTVTGPVTVALAGLGRLWLDTETEPELQAAGLLVGQRIEAHGLLSGAPGAATVAAASLKVKPGSLEGRLTGVQLGAGTISLQVTGLDDPFGGAPPAGAIVARVATGAWIEGPDGLITLPDLAAMLAGLSGDEFVELELDGIRDSGGAIVVWELEAEIED